MRENSGLLDRTSVTLMFTGRASNRFNSYYFLGLAGFLRAGAAVLGVVTAFSERRWGEEPDNMAAFPSL